MPENDEFLTQKPEGQEIETYTFNRKDIKNIAYEVLIDQADEVINEAIAEGKIILPPGGTKLYLHRLVGTWNDNENYDIGIISDTSHQATIDFLGLHFLNAKINYSIGSYINSSRGELFPKAFIFLNGTAGTVVTKVISTLTSDTVTEL